MRISCILRGVYFDVLVVQTFIHQNGHKTIFTKEYSGLGSIFDALEWSDT